MSKWGEAFDAAEDGPAFGGVLQGLFAALEKAMDEEAAADD
jgi:hypothetical protein